MANEFLTGAMEWAGDIVGSAAGKLWEWTKETAAPIVQEARKDFSWILNAAGEVLPNMLPTATAALAELQFRGSQGNFSTTLYPIVLKCEFLRTSDPLPERYGYPCNEFRALGGVSGFVLCKDAQVKISGTIDEELAIEAFLNQGAFIDWTNVPIP